MRLIFFVMIVFLSSCKDNRVYDNIIPLPPDGWKANYSLHFDVDIKDAKKNYTLMYNVRFANTYEYYNLYVRYQVLDSTGRLISKKLQGMDLFNPKTGKPNGNGLGDKFDFDIISDD
ncbi:MAG TPA: gliding motility lipoprotein GldH, partial [Cytophagaceae bacterium]